MLAHSIDYRVDTAQTADKDTKPRMLNDKNQRKGGRTIAQQVCTHIVRAKIQSAELRYSLEIDLVASTQTGV